MKRILPIALSVAAAVCVFSCAKTPVTGVNDANKRYFDAWMHINHPDLQPTGLGIYVIDQTEGTGAEVTEEGCAFVDYILTNLEGDITSYTDKQTAKQMGTYDTTVYYGPAKWFTPEGVLQAGVREALIGMKVGGRKKVIIPSWLMSYKTYGTEEEYLNESSDATSAIYDITVTDFTDSIYRWEIGQIGKYLADNQDIYKGMTAADSVSYGFYYKELEAPSVTDSLPSDTTIYINYTGKLLNGLVFDTTSEKVAKDNGLYSASRSYEPVPVKLAEKYEDITLSGSTTIAGFSKTIKQMSNDEKGIGIFWSQLGYSTGGNGSSIPGYAPLIFEIELVAKPED